MARTNIEDSLWSDQRFLKFLVKIGDEEKALGAIALAWKVAQKYWCPSKGLVPLKEWEASPSRVAMIECGLAELRGDLVYVKGSEKHFAWWFQKQKAGEASGEARQKKPRKSHKKSPDSERTLTDVQQSFDVRQHMSTSSSSSPSPSLSSSESTSDSYLYSVGGEGSPREIKSPVGFFIANYVNAYQQRYGPKARPSLAGKVQGQIKRFVEETSLDRACQLIQTYCEMSDGWFLTKAHDFGTFLENLNKVGLKLDTGKELNRSQIGHEEKKQFAKSQIERITKGEL